MTISPDVARLARHYGLDPALIQAVCNAEGDIVKAVSCGIPNVTTRAEAIEITCRSAAHALSDYVKANCAPDFVAFWAERWAPIGAKNDPSDLNKNWPVNVLKLWTAK